MNYSFGRIPRANERDRAIDVRDEFAFELEIFHFERDVELSSALVILAAMGAGIRVLG